MDGTLIKELGVLEEGEMERKTAQQHKQEQQILEEGEGEVQGHQAEMEEEGVKELLLLLILPQSFLIREEMKRV